MRTEKDENIRVNPARFKVYESHLHPSIPYHAVPMPRDEELKIKIVVYRQECWLIEQVNSLLHRLFQRVHVPLRLIKTAMPQQAIHCSDLRAASA
jgi:hypothetical protein